MPYTPPHKLSLSPSSSSLSSPSFPPSPSPVSPLTSVPGSLSASALRIAHSRSASDIGLSSIPGAAAAIATVYSSCVIDDSPQSPDSADSFFAERMSSMMVRKKSGELVKPALRDSSRPRRPVSMPGTPTQTKAVHFRDNIAQVRHFLWQDRPMAVSAGSSPVLAYESDTEFPFPDIAAAATFAAAARRRWQFTTINWPDETELGRRSLDPVQLERLFLSADGASLVGSVAVANIAFQKTVVCRFTLDHWTTVSEVVAEYSDDATTSSVDKLPALSSGFDRFVFTIRLVDLPRLEIRPMLACIRYSAGGQDYWDNNNGSNYHVEFTRNTPPKVQTSLQAAPVAAIPQARPAAPAIPRSRRSANHRRSSSDSSLAPLSLPPVLGSSGAGEGEEGSYPIRSHRRRDGSIASVDSDSDLPPIRFRPRSRQTQDADPLSSRYDFSLSVSIPTERSVESPPEFAIAPLVAGNDKADVGSDEYREMLAKFCFFSPAARPRGASLTGSPPSKSSKSLAQASDSTMRVESIVDHDDLDSDKNALPDLVHDTPESESSEDQPSSHSSASSPESSGSSNPPSPDFAPSALGLDFSHPASWPSSTSSTPPPQSTMPLDMATFATLRSRSASPALVGRSSRSVNHAHIHSYGAMPLFATDQRHPAACIRG